MREAANIVLTGFMGVGKTTVGKRLAARLGMRFIDLDELIERDAGLTVAEIFRRDGEARFRALESAAVLRLASGVYGSGLVVSAGGGAVVDETSRKALRSWAAVVRLTAPLDVIMKRVGAKTDRPLLAGDEGRSRAAELLESREAAYADCDLTIDTSATPPDEAASLIAAFVERRK